MSTAASGSAICATMPHSSGEAMTPWCHQHSDTQWWQRRGPQIPVPQCRPAMALTKAQGLPTDPHHPPELPAGAGEQQVAGEPKKRGTEHGRTPVLGWDTRGQHLLLLGLCIHHDGDVALDEREGEEGDGVEVTSTGFLGGAAGRGWHKDLESGKVCHWDSSKGATGASRCHPGVSQGGNRDGKLGQLSLHGVGAHPIYKKPFPLLLCVAAPHGLSPQGFCPQRWQQGWQHPAVTKS